MQLDTALQFHSASMRRRKINASRLRVRLFAFLILADQLCILLGFGLGEVIRSGPVSANMGFNLIYLAAPLYLTLSMMCNGYSRPVLQRAEHSIGRALLSISVTGAATLTAVFLLGASEDVSRLNLIVSFLMSAVALVAMRRIFAIVVRKFIGSVESVLVILDDPAATINVEAGHDLLDAKAQGLQADVGDPNKMHNIGMVLVNYDRVIVHCESARRADWALVLKGGNVKGEIVQPSLRTLGAVGISQFGDHNTLVIAKGPLSLPSRIQKRIFDLAFTLPVILAALPALALIALAIKLDSPGPILFKQKRIGRSNRLFDIYKFRSMRVEQLDHGGNRSASRDDDRITRVGKIIRRTSMDELPQLFNVLLGDMSLVGPRPHALGSLAGNQLFWDVSREYWCRHALKPGITGLAQVRGFRGATHQMSDLQNRLEADLEYVSGWTLLRDLHILVSTFKVLLHKNAY